MSEANDKHLERARGLLRSFLYRSRIALLVVGSRYRVTVFGVYLSRPLFDQALVELRESMK